MNFFRRKSFHNPSSSKEHYFLPYQNQKDSQSSSNHSDQEQNQPHETVIINNFSEKAKIKIDIVYNDHDQIQVEKSQKILPKYPVNNNQLKITQSNLSKRLVFDSATKQGMKVFEGDSVHPPTPIKTPKYNYRHSYDKSSDNIETPMHKYDNNMFLTSKNIQTKENYINDERKNQRYFNTEVTYPYPITSSPSFIKSFQTTAERQGTSANLDHERTPFPQKSIENQKRDLLREKRLEISQKLKNRSVFAQPKQKSFYKIPQFVLNQSISRVQQNSKNQAENDRPFEEITQNEDYQENQQKAGNFFQPFFVREQISDDLLQDKESPQKRMFGLEPREKSSGPIESEIAEQVNHENSFFDSKVPNNEIEDVIMPRHNMEKSKTPKIEIIQPEMRLEEANSDAQDEHDYEKTSSHIVPSDHNSSYMNQSQSETNQLKALQIEQQNYFSNKNTENQNEPNQPHPDTSLEQIPQENHNIQNQLEWKKSQNPLQTEAIEAKKSTITETKIETDKILKEVPSVPTGKWQKQKSSQTLNVREYSTRPKIINQATQINNHEQSIAYSLDETPNNSIQNNSSHSNILNENIKQQEAIEHPYQDEFILMSLKSKQLNKNLNPTEKPEDSINELSEILNASPKYEPEDHSELNQRTENIQEKYEEPEEFHLKYEIVQELNTTNKKQHLTLKCESVISYSISPSPKNIKFSSSKITNKNTPKSTLQKDKMSLRSSDKISLTSSMRNSLSRSKSKSKDSPKTYQELQKYKRLFRKQKQLKKTQIQLSKIQKAPTEKSLTKYSEIHKPKGYLQRSALMKNQDYIKVEQNNYDEYPLNDTPKSRQKIKNYFTEINPDNQKEEEHVRFSYPRNNQDLKKQDSESKFSQNTWVKPNPVNLKDKKAEDLFIKHKDEFLNKLKKKEKEQKQISTVASRSSSRSNEKSIFMKLTCPNTTQNSPNMTSNYQSTRKRPLSPFIQNITNRLASPNPKKYICEHYKKYSRRDLRKKFQELLEKDDNLMLRRYFFSQEEMNQIFLQEILGKEINEMYWVEVLKNYGERKLEMIRLKEKANFHPFEKRVVRQEQLMGDARRTYRYQGNFYSENLKSRYENEGSSYESRGQENEYDGRYQNYGDRNSQNRNWQNKEERRWEQNYYSRQPYTEQY